MSDHLVFKTTINRSKGRHGFQYNNSGTLQHSTNINRLEVNKETKELTYTTDQMDPNTELQEFHYTDAEYTFFPTVQGSFYRIE